MLPARNDATFSVPCRSPPDQVDPLQRFGQMAPQTVEEILDCAGAIGAQVLSHARARFDRFARRVQHHSQHRHDQQKRDAQRA